MIIPTGSYVLQVLLGLAFPPAILSFEFKSKKELSNMPVTFEDYQAEHTREQTLTQNTVNFTKNCTDGNALDGEPAVQFR